MALLKTLSRKVGGCSTIQKYLERDGRSLAIDANNVGDIDNWAEVFDFNRRYFWKDEGRKYYHFVLSPDPSDGATLEQVRDLATSWARERYPNGQWVIEYHDDGDNGGIHAHIVVNAVLPISGEPFAGRKIRISKSDSREDARRVQELCKDMGLTYFGDRHGNPTFHQKDDYIIHPQDLGVVVSAQDIEGRTFVADIRHAVDEAIEHSQTFAQFRTYLKDQGFGCEYTNRGIKFIHPHIFGTSGRHFEVRATERNIGDGYTLDAILERLPQGHEHAAVGLFEPKEAPLSIHVGERSHGAGVRMSLAEKRLVEAGGHSWKQDIRQAVDEVAPMAANMDEFARLMAERGIEVKRGRRGITYVHPDVRPGTDTHYTVRGTEANLGYDYTLDGVISRLKPNPEHHRGAIMSNVRSTRRLNPPRTLAGRVQALGDRSTRIGNARIAPEKVIAAVVVVDRGGYTSVNQMNEKLDELRSEADSLRSDVDEAQRDFDFASEAWRRIDRIAEIDDEFRQGAMSSALARERQEHERWLSYRGIDANDPASSAIQPINKAKKRLDELVARSSKLNGDAQRLSDAVETINKLGIYGTRPAGERARHEAMVEAITSPDYNLSQTIRIVKGIQATAFGDEAWRKMAVAHIEEERFLERHVAESRSSDGQRVQEELRQRQIAEEQAKRAQEQQQSQQVQRHAPQTYVPKPHRGR